MVLSVLVGAMAPAATDALPARAADHRPSRIISLSPTATETLFAIGAGTRVVAVDDQSNYPKRAPHTDLSGYRPNVESIAGYRPDLVILSSGGMADQLKALGITVLVEPAASSLAESYAEIRQLGKATGRVAAARRLVDDMRAGIATISATIPKRRVMPMAYYELDETLYSADSTTFIGQLLKLAGVGNIADGATKGASGYPQLSAEFVVQANPSVIFLADTKCCGQSEATVASRPGFSQIRAVRTHHVVALDDDIASRWGPRVVDLYRKLVESTNTL
jgi:iron complex transport system substrate-binding protein